MTEKISVIVPIYNQELLLKRCVDSIINQTYRNLEIILVDDGSTDASPQICDSYAAVDERIKVIHQENGGLSAARNAGLDIAKGDYVAFVDSDDFIDAKMYETLLTKSLAYDADIVVCNAFNFQHDKALPRKNHIVNEKLLDNPKEKLNFLLSKTDNCGIEVWNKLYCKKLFATRRFPDVPVAEDLFIAFDLFIDCNSILFCPNMLYYYYYNPNGLVLGSKPIFHAYDVFEWERIIALLRENGMNELTLLAVYRLKDFYYFWRNKFRLRKCNDHDRKVIKEADRVMKTEYYRYVKNKKIKNVMCYIWPDAYFTIRSIFKRSK